MFTRNSAQQLWDRLEPAFSSTLSASKASVLEPHFSVLGLSFGTNCRVSHTGTLQLVVNI